MVATAALNRFIPEQLNCADFAQLEPLYLALLERTLETVGRLTAWLEDFSALTAVVDEFGSRRYIDTSRRICSSLSRSSRRSSRSISSYRRSSSNRLPVPCSLAIVLRFLCASGWPTWRSSAARMSRSTRRSPS
jgi:hypothetical protein